MKRVILKSLAISFLLVFLAACESVYPNYPQEANQADFVHRSMKQLTDVIVHDIIFSTGRQPDLCLSQHCCL